MNSKEYREYNEELGYSPQQIDLTMRLSVEIKLKKMGYSPRGIERIMKNNYGSGIFNKKRNLKFEEKVFEAYEETKKHKEKVSKLLKEAEKHEKQR